jgi:hypothetical protein
MNINFNISHVTYVPRSKIENISQPRRVVMWRETELFIQQELVAMQQLHCVCRPETLALSLKRQELTSVGI